MNAPWYKSTGFDLRVVSTAPKNAVLIIANGITAPKIICSPFKLNTVRIQWSFFVKQSLSFLRSNSKCLGKNNLMPIGTIDNAATQLKNDNSQNAFDGCLKHINPIQLISLSKYGVVDGFWLVRNWAMLYHFVAMHAVSIIILLLLPRTSNYYLMRESCNNGLLTEIEQRPLT